MNVCLYPRCWSIFLNIFESIHRTDLWTNSAGAMLQIRLQRICESKVTDAHSDTENLSSTFSQFLVSRGLVRPLAAAPPTVPYIYITRPRPTRSPDWVLGTNRSPTVTIRPTPVFNSQFYPTRAQGRERLQQRPDYPPR